MCRPSCHCSTGSVDGPGQPGRRRGHDARGGRARPSRRRGVLELVRPHGVHDQRDGAPRRARSLSALASAAAPAGGAVQRGGPDDDVSEAYWVLGRCSGSAACRWRRRYVNRPELTRERFVPDPFSDGGGATGRVTVAALENGEIEFKGSTIFS